MRSKLFKKRVNISRKTYNLEVEVTLAHLHGREASDRDILKHRKLRARYEKFNSNPEYLRRLYKTFL